MPKSIVLPNAAEKPNHREPKRTIFANFCVHGAVTALCHKEEKNIVVKNVDSMPTANLSERVKKHLNLHFPLNKWHCSAEKQV